MEFIGKWIVKKTMHFGEDGVKHLTKEELIAVEGDDADLEMFNSIVNIKEDGVIETLVQVPADQVEEAKAQGAPVDENGCICVDKMAWKEENGEILYEENGEFVPFVLTEDGLLRFAAGMMLLERTE